MKTQIQIQLEKTDKTLIQEVSKLLGIGHSTFCKQVSMREARKILIENNLEVQTV